MNYEVFISHSRNDIAFANVVCSNLELKGIRCWITPRDIRTGDDWPDAIAKAIGFCQVMVLIFSSAAQSSEQVVSQIMQWADTNKAIIPVRIENVAPNGAFSYYLQGQNWIDATTGPADNHIQALSNLVLDVLGKQNVAFGDTSLLVTPGNPAGSSSLPESAGVPAQNPPQFQPLFSQPYTPPSGYTEAQSQPPAQSYQAPSVYSSLAPQSPPAGAASPPPQHYPTSKSSQNYDQQGVAGNPNPPLAGQQSQAYSAPAHPVITSPLQPPTKELNIFQKSWHQGGDGKFLALAPWMTSLLYALLMGFIGNLCELLGVGQHSGRIRNMGIVGDLMGMIFFDILLFRLYSNLDTFHTRGKTSTSWWLVVYNYIPIMNFFRPYILLQEAWKASDPDANSSKPLEWRSKRSNPLINVFWSVEIISDLIIVATFVVDRQQPSSHSLMEAISLIVGFIDSLLTFIIIYQFNARQAKKYETIGSVPIAPAASA